MIVGTLVLSYVFSTFFVFIVLFLNNATVTIKSFSLIRFKTIIQKCFSYFLIFDTDIEGHWEGSTTAKLLTVTLVIYTITRHCEFTLVSYFSVIFICVAYLFTLIACLMSYQVSRGFQGCVRTQKNFFWTTKSQNFSFFVQKKLLHCHLLLCIEKCKSALSYK